MERGAVFQQPNAPSRHIGYVEKGCFKYIVHNDAGNKDYITGFALENEFVADYPQNHIGRRRNYVLCRKNYV